MVPLSKNAASAYRRIDLDARIEASAGEDLTLICLEEAMAAMGQALLTLERLPEHPPAEPLARAHGIAMWLAKSVAPDNPLRSAMVQFYVGIAATIARNRVRASYAELAQVREDFADLLRAAKAAEAV